MTAPRPGLSRSDKNYYADSGLDRATELRKDAAWLAERLADPSSRLIPVWRSRNLVVAGDSPDRMAQAAILPAADHKDLLEHSAETVLLGVSADTAYFAVDLSQHSAPESLPTLSPPHYAEPAEFLDLRFTGHHLPRHEGGMLVYARGMLTWHRRHAHCGTCGSPTESRDAGHIRKCVNPDCDSQHFPRTDPAVIMLVTKGDRCLLGRQAAWMQGMYSTLAGFVEPGETLESAVAREVHEESGIRVSDVRYHSSQPWPFPTSLMLGFYATAESEEVTVNTDELEDVRWFDRDWIHKNGDGGEFRLPRKVSIARRLVDDWLNGDGV